jgi:ADP-ribosylglycohydrolase
VGTLAVVVSSSTHGDVIAVGGAAAAYGAIGLVVAGWVEAFRSIRADRPARWGEPTVYGTVLAASIGGSIEALHRVGVL